MKPWEKYQEQAASGNSAQAPQQTQPVGPWTKYADGGQSSLSPQQISGTDLGERPTITGGRGIGGQRAQQQEYDYKQDLAAAIPEFTGNLAELQEIGAAPEMNEMNWNAAKASIGASLIGSDVELAQMLKERFPETSFTRDKELNLIATMPSGGSYYLNAPGFSGQDAIKFLTRAGLYSLGGAPVGVGAKALGRVATTSAAAETGAQSLEQLAGGEFDKGDIVAATVAGPAGQVVGQKVIAPALAAPAKTIKSVLGGGRGSQQRIQAAIDDFAEFGDVPTVGVAGQRWAGFENTLSKYLGGRPMKDAIENTRTRMQARVENIADDLSRVRGDVEAGRVIEKGIRGDGGFINRFQDKSTTLWNRFDNIIGENTDVALANTARTLDDVVSSSEIGQVLNNPLLSRIRDAVASSGNRATFGDIKALRSEIGRRLADNDLISDIPRSQLKRVYGALTQDMDVLAQNTSADAVKAFNRANNFTRAGHNRVDSFLQRVVKKDDLDKVFNSLAKGGEGTQSLNAFKRSLKPEEWEAVASNVIRRMGRATAGYQDDLGEAFSVNKFLTDWNKLGPSKKVLFSGSPRLNEYGKNLEKIASAANRMKDASRDMANPSGTAQAAINIGASASAIGQLATGNLEGAAAILATVAANNAGMRLMSSPAFVRWLAQATTTSNMPAHIARLTAVAEQTGMKEEIAQYLSDLAEMGNDSPEKADQSSGNMPH